MGCCGVAAHQQLLWPLHKRRHHVKPWQAPPAAVCSHVCPAEAHLKKTYTGILAIDCSRHSKTKMLEYCQQGTTTNATCCRWHFIMSKSIDFTKGIFLPQVDKQSLNANIMQDLLHDSQSCTHTHTHTHTHTKVTSQSL